LYVAIKLYKIFFSVFSVVVSAAIVVVHCYLVLLVCVCFVVVAVCCFCCLDIVSNHMRSLRVDTAV